MSTFTIAGLVGTASFVATVAGAAATRASTRVRPVRVDAGRLVEMCRRAARRRLDQPRYERALPNVLEAVARGVRGGRSLVDALEDAQPLQPALLHDDWRRLVAAANDVGITEAAGRWACGRALPSIRLVANALAVAADAGGPQARAIDSVAITLRQRLALAAEVRALSSQARASAGLIGLAPVGFAVVASALEPRYLGFLFGTAPGAVMFATAIVLDVAGIVWMARLARVVA